MGLRDHLYLGTPQYSYAHSDQDCDLLATRSTCIAWLHASLCPHNINKLVIEHAAQYSSKEQLPISINSASGRCKIGVLLHELTSHFTRSSRARVHLVNRPVSS